MKNKSIKRIKKSITPIKVKAIIKIKGGATDDLWQWRKND